VSRQILIADSDDAVRSGLRILLLPAGYTTIFATDGVSLVEQARKHQPNLIMLDLCLPAGNALTLIQTLRRFPDLTRTPIFIFAGREHRMRANEVFEAGADGFLPKPFNRQILLMLIAKFLPSENSVGTLNPVDSVVLLPRQAFSRPSLV
jgi:two-component system KDP operon response regulator KdpE